MKRISWLGWVLFAVTIALIILFWKGCGDKPKPVITKKQGKTELVNSVQTITFDTLKWIATYKANSKPIIKWVKPKTIHDTIEVKPLFSPCDSIFSSSDTGSIQGVKYAIVDTISDNRVIGRSIKLQVPQTQITKQVMKVNDSLRVDTVYINQKQKFGTNAKWFFRGFAVGGAAGLVGGSFIPR
jgi:hypothetical protein